MTERRLPPAQISHLLRLLKGWKHAQGVLRKTYVFSGFLPAMVFVNFVAEEAERMDHHPDILVQYKKVTLTLSTHSVGGLTEKDFTLAKKLDA